VAVWPPDEVVAAVASLPRPEVVGLRWTGADQWHVTLRFYGTTEVEPAAAALRRTSAPPTVACMGPATERFGAGVLHVPVSGLDALAAEVADPCEDRPFHGHVTLARARGKGIDLRPYCGWPITASWPVTEITLVASSTLASGARYTVVERAPLR